MRINDQSVWWSLSILTLLIHISASCQTKLPQPPNIIWLMAEDISLDLECYGMKGVQTPNLNQLAEDGRMYTNCYVTNSICSPSRSAMMVGVHQLRINSHNHRSNRDTPLPEPYKPFTYWLRKHGYTTILGHHAVFHKGMKTDVNFKSQAIGNWDGLEEFGLFDKKHEFNTSDQPFFAQIQLKVTHRGDWWQEIREQSIHPVYPDSIALPPYYADDPVIRMDWARYLDQIEYMDHEVGLIRQELEEKGMAHNTIIIFIGDNGRCNIRGKGYLHDPGLHIPLIVYYPDQINDGQISDQLISATDITATILDIAGVAIPEYMTGSSFLKKNFSRTQIYASRDRWDEIQDSSRSVTDGRWKYIRNYRPEVPFDAHQAYLEFYRPAVHIMRKLNEEGLLTEEQKFFFENTKPGEEFYDTENDPFEVNNLALNPGYAEQIAMWKKNLDEQEKQNQSDTPYKEDTVHPKSVDVIKWLEMERPELIERIQAGEEIGLSRLKKDFEQNRKKLKNER